MDDYTLLHGDCLEEMAAMDAGSVDAVVTDPPYFLPAAHYQTRKQFPRCLSDLGMLEHFYRDWFDETARVLKPTGVAYVFCDGQSYPVFYALGYKHFRRQVPLVWDKMVSINGYSWRHQHELILFAQMPAAPAVPTGDGDILRHRAVPVNERDHPAEKPIPLLRSLVAKSTNPGDVVLDPFAGSGTTGVACVEEGREFIGIEREQEYLDIARRRIEHASAQGRLPLDESPPLPPVAGRPT